MRMNLSILTTLLWLVAFSATGAVTRETDDETAGEEIFASVGDATISVAAYREALNRQGRNLFYHGTPPEGELVAFQQKVADELINRHLLIQEVRRRGLVADASELDKRFGQHLARAQRMGRTIVDGSDEWRALRAWVEEEIVIKQLEQAIRVSLPPVSEDDLRTYYSDHPEKFTEPEQLHLSSILFQVPSSSPPETWTAARQEAEDIVKRLRGGADFAELARLHSGDMSAENGGDMGYLHKGMISAEAQAVIDELATGQISEPVVVLEGVVIFRLNDRKPSSLQDFQMVQQRVEQLLKNEKSDAYWSAFIEQLRTSTTIHIEKKYLTLSGEVDKGNSAMNKSSN